MGLPSWKKDGIAVVGHDVVGSPTWESCSRKIPDLNCITRCLGRKVIQNVKANNKQKELQNLMESLTNTKRSIQEVRSLVERGRTLVDSTLNGLEKVNNEIKVGVDISKFLNGKNTNNNLNISNACFHDTLENAERSLVKFFINADVANQKRTLNVEAALDGNLETNLAEGIANQMYPGYFEFSKKLEQVKLLLSDLDGQKSDIARDIDTLENGKTEQQQRSQITWSAEEDEFRKLAFGELPRFTLSDDETIQAFEEKSIWEIAPNNDPLFKPTKKISAVSGTKKSIINDNFDENYNKSLCEQLRRSINHFQDIVYPLSEFTESFLQEKIMFYRQKNRRLADLRMIDDQIKSDCFVENCTMEDMDNALSYLGRAREGTLKWAKVIDGQIEDQNKIALSYFANRTRDIIRTERGVTLRHFISKSKSAVEQAIKKSAIEDDDNGSHVDDVSKDLYSLLVGVKNSEELSKMAPKIFNMKRKIQELRKLPCRESDVRLFLHKKYGATKMLRKRNLTLSSHDTETTKAKVEKLVKPSPQPLVTKPIAFIKTSSKHNLSKELMGIQRSSIGKNTNKKPTRKRQKSNKNLHIQHKQETLKKDRNRSYQNSQYANLPDTNSYKKSEEPVYNEQYFSNMNYPSINYNLYPYWKK